VNDHHDKAREFVQWARENWQTSLLWFLFWPFLIFFKGAALREESNAKTWADAEARVYEAKVSKQTQRRLVEAEARTQAAEAEAKALAAELKLEGWKERAGR